MEDYENGGGKIYIIWERHQFWLQEKTIVGLGSKTMSTRSTPFEERCNFKMFESGITYKYYFYSLTSA